MSLATISRPSTNEKKGSPDPLPLEQAPTLPSHIRAVGTHHRITKGSGYYWIGTAQSIPLNDEGLVIRGIVLYNATNCLFLQKEETQEAIQEAQQMLHSFFNEDKNGDAHSPSSETASKSTL